jgi:hypothetical protein
MIVIYAITFILVASLVWLWVGRIDYMKKNHPDYKGEDFLNWDLEKHTAGRDGWDDNRVHTEGEI